MSLVTRCTACGTLFKVVADQLKISQGWVRCGQCAHVFDAQANLVEPTAGVPSDPVGAPSVPGSPSIAIDSVAVHADSKPAIPAKSFENQSIAAASERLGDSTPADSSLSASRLSLDSQNDLNLIPPDSRAFQPGLLRDSRDLDSEAGPSTTSWVNSDYAAHAAAIRPASDGIGRSAEPTTLDGSILSTPPAISLPSTPPSLPTTTEGPPSTQPQPTPGFVKQAQRAARWRSPWVRLGLAMFALVLLAALVLQVALREKDLIAARYPQAKPWLEQLCQHTGCRVEAIKRIEAIVIDSSSFNRINKNNPQLEASVQSYRLSVVLKNTGALPVAAPHVELSLQDAQDQPVLRRVLSPADLGSSQSSLAPTQELAGSLTLQISTPQLAGSRINGYRVLAFYP